MGIGLQQEEHGRMASAAGMTAQHHDYLGTKPASMAATHVHSGWHEIRPVQQHRIPLACCLCRCLPPWAAVQAGPSGGRGEPQCVCNGTQHLGAIYLGSSHAQAMHATTAAVIASNMPPLTSTADQPSVSASYLQFGHLRPGHLRLPAARPPAATCGLAKVSSPEDHRSAAGRPCAAWARSMPPWVCVVH